MMLSLAQRSAASLRSASNPSRTIRVRSTATATIPQTLRQHHGMVRTSPAPLKRYHSSSSSSSSLAANKTKATATKQHESTDPQVASATASSSSTAAPKDSASSFLGRFLAPKEMPERYSFAWFGEMLRISAVFGTAGMLTVGAVRPAVRDLLGIEGSFRDGPWSYRICSLLVFSPIHAALLVAVGTVFGRHAYFRHIALKLLSRFGLRPELVDKQWKLHQQQFKAW